jgi:hypothetical protein
MDPSSKRNVRAAVCTVAITLASTAPLLAQGRVKPAPTPAHRVVLAAPGPQYQAGGLQRFFLGSNWREAWARPLRLPVLDLDAFAGGLTPEREGGNKQSITLHLVDAQGRGWVFRSLDKYPAKQLADGLEGTPAGTVVQDQTSAMYPAGQFMLPPLLDALGILYIAGMPYVMPDDSRNLGKFNETFAGMIGVIEAKPADGNGGKPGFAGSAEVIDADDMLEELEKDPSNQVAQRELLRGRLLDFVINDTDRATDNYEFARFPHPDGGDRHLWRPIPRDRDWAFVNARGLLVKLAAGSVLPKMVGHGERHSSLEAHTFGAHIIDRSLLTALDRSVFEAEVAFVKERLNDHVIAAAVSRVPPSYPESEKRALGEAMKARRNSLAEIANEFYAWLASDVDVHGTDVSEQAEIVRHADGSVNVTLSARSTVAADAANDGGPTHENEAVPHYERVFLPGETHEVRLFLHGGDDVAVVRGQGSGITIRVMGGSGNDTLQDASTQREVRLYDSEGDNRFVKAKNTRVDERDWDAPKPPQGSRFGIDWAPDWGASRSWKFSAGHGEASGLVVGAGQAWRDHDFRRLPYRWQVEASALYGIRARAPGAEVRVDYRLENAPHSIETAVRWSGFDGFRWSGLGNDSEGIASELSLVSMDRLTVEPAFVWRFGQWRMDDPETEEDEKRDPSEPREQPFRGSLGFGPLLSYTRTEGVAQSPFALDRPLGFDPLWQAGAGARLELRRTDRRQVPRRGVKLQASLNAYPGMLDLPGAYGTARAEVNGYIPLIGDGPHLALRAGANRAIGDVPAFDFATIGGRRTLRGFTSRRFAGDAAAYGGAELRIPLARMKLLVEGDLGVFALADAGRVWVDGESPGGWHTGWGGGLWFDAFERAVSVAYATGERGKLYVWLGLPF